MEWIQHICIIRFRLPSQMDLLWSSLSPEDWWGRRSHQKEQWGSQCKISETRWKKFFQILFDKTIKLEYLNSILSLHEPILNILCTKLLLPPSFFSRRNVQPPNNTWIALRNLPHPSDRYSCGRGVSNIVCLPAVNGILATADKIFNFRRWRFKKCYQGGSNRV